MVRTLAKRHTERMEAGRNDPRLRGSGKKFKKRRGAGTDAGKFIPFPGVQESVEAGRLDADGHPLAFMEGSGTSSFATVAIKGIRAALDGGDSPASPSRSVLPKPMPRRGGAGLICFSSSFRAVTNAARCR